MSRVVVAIAVLLVVAGAVRAAGIRRAERTSVVASLTVAAPRDGAHETVPLRAADSPRTVNSLSPGRRAPVPSVMWAGLATIGALGWIRRKRRRSDI